MQNKKSLLRNRFKLKREGPKNRLHDIHQVHNTIGKSEPVVTFPELNNMETELQINSTRFPRPKKDEKNTIFINNFFTMVNTPLHCTVPTALTHRLSLNTRFQCNILVNKRSYQQELIQGVQCVQFWMRSNIFDQGQK